MARVGEEHEWDYVILSLEGSGKTLKLWWHLVSCERDGTVFAQNFTGNDLYI